MYRYKFNDKNYYIALYIRLSREDGDDLESESITHQRDLLLNFTNYQNLEVIDIYIDDGYSGGNFNRPEFKRMIQDIECKKINCVITKDLSRLGRDFIETGRYIEKYFPENNIRYIALNDDIDTFNENSSSDLMPFRLSMNDMYAKDISKKVKSVLLDMKKEGKFCGSKPPYGYMNDPNDKHHLIINPQQADTVKKIFDLYIAGYSSNTIADILTKEECPTPITYFRSKEKLNPNLHPEIWKDKSIINILSNRVYTGCIIQHTTQSVSYKSKKRKKVPKEEWCIKENMHEPIISKEVFEIVQSMKNKSNNYKSNRRHVEYSLKDLVFCKDCGARMSISYDKKRDRTSMNCNNYRKFSKYNICFSHFINYDLLEEEICKKIKNLSIKYIKDIDEFEKIIKQNYFNPKIIIDNKLENLQKEILILQKKQDALYDDKFNEIITTEVYQRLYSNTEDKIENNRKKIIELTKEKENLNPNYSEIINSKKIIEKFLNIENPTKEMMHKIINKIYITKNKEIEIHYKICKQTLSV